MGSFSQGIQLGKTDPLLREVKIVLV